MEAKKKEEKVKLQEERIEDARRKHANRKRKVGVDSLKKGRSMTSFGIR